MIDSEKIEGITASDYVHAMLQAISNGECSLEGPEPINPWKIRSKRIMHSICKDNNIKLDKLPEPDKGFYMKDHTVLSALLAAYMALDNRGVFKR